MGYEKADIANLIDALKASRIEVLVDIREHVQSWKPGFPKTGLAEAAQSVGIEYMHFRTLSDPKAGPDAARAGVYLRFNNIYRAVIETSEAESAVQDVIKVAKSEKICLYCELYDYNGVPPRDCSRALRTCYIGEGFAYRSCERWQYRMHLTMNSYIRQSMDLAKIAAL